jgi:hypothetical protein
VAGRSTGRQVILLSPSRGRWWRWSYHDPERGVALPSNREYESRKNAEEAASLAYPGVAISEEAGPAGSGAGVAVMGLTVVGLALLAATGVGVVIVVAVLMGKRGIRKLLRAGS